VEPAPAAPPAPPLPSVPPGATDRTINGHTFIPEILVRSPFAATAASADLLYGSGNATGPAFDVNGVPMGFRTYTFAAMAQTFGYDKKVAEGISVGGGLITQLFSGIDGPSLVVVGAQIGGGLFGRATAGTQLGPVQAALTFDAIWGPRIGLLVIQAIQKALDQRVLDTASAFSMQNAWTLKPGFAASWALWRPLGLTGSVDYQWIAINTSDEVPKHGAGVDLGLAADLDFGTFTPVAMGVLAAIHTTSPLGSDSGVERVNDYSLGLFYTGRPALVLGLEVGRRDLTIRELATKLVVAQLRLQYVW